MKIILRHLFHLLVTFSLMALFSCEKTTTEPEPDVTVYSNPEHWLSLPSASSKIIDIFYVYPTAWYKLDPSEPNFSAIDNKIMKAGANSAFKKQASVFETIGNIYAPYYRQADGKYTLSLPENERWDVIGSIPAKDVITSFDYYIKNYNKGRPYILLGHSQGSNVLLFLLKDYMSKNPSVYSRMICAYVIGYPVTAEFMQSNKHLKFAEGSDDLGVIVSYNTQSPNVTSGSNIVVGDNIGIAINPINWKRDETIANASESLGSYMPIDNEGNYGFVDHFADARINHKKGILECSSVKDSAMYKLSATMGLGVYHSFDIQFYYYNLRENAQKRVNKFLSK